MSANLPELRDYIRFRRAALAGFMEQGVELALDGDFLRVIPRYSIYTRYLNDNRAALAEMASDFFGTTIEVRIEAEASASAASAPGGGANVNGSGPSPGEAKGPDRPEERKQPAPPVSFALAYARRTYRVFPCHEIEADGECSCGKLNCSSAGKHPRITDWQALATIDEEQIREWWSQWPQANIGIKTGADSNLTVLDIDGDEGRDQVQAWEIEHGELPETPLARTGRGGMHYYFRFEPGVQNAVRFAPGLDIRTEGGLVVGVGSKTTGAYEWGVPLSNELHPARMPEWLIELMQKAGKNENGKRESFKGAEQPLHEGERRNNYLYRMGRSLRARAFPESAIRAAVRAANEEQCVPPLLAVELETLIANILKQPDQDDFARAGFGPDGKAGQPEQAEAPSGLNLLNIEQLLRYEVQPRELVLDPIIHEKDIDMIFSWRGTGKTLVALEAAYAIASGGKCLKWNAPRPRRVLYIDGELPLPVLKQRVARIAAAHDEEPPVDFVQFITPDAQEDPIPNLAEGKGQAMIDQIIADQKIEVLFIDSISTLCSSGRENEAESWLPVQAWALRLRRRGLTVIFVHHAGKGGAQRGTSRREDILDLVIHLVHPSDYRPDEGSRFEVHFEKGRESWGDALKPFEARLEVRDCAAQWTIRDVEDLNLNRAKTLFDEGLSIRDVAEALNISKSAAARLKIKLKKEAKT